MSVFRESESSRLRASIRALVPAVVTLVLFLIGEALLATALDTIEVGSAEGEMVLGLLARGTLYVVLIGVALGLATKLDRRPYAAFGLDVDLGWARDFVAGIVIGLFGVSATLWYASARGFVDVDLGAVGVSESVEPAGFAVVLIVLLGYFLLGNVYEEIVYRGIVIQNFAEGLVERGFSPVWAVVPATAGSLVLFGLFHVPLRGNVIVAVDAAIVGIAFALPYLLTGKLGLSIGVHFGHMSMEFAFTGVASGIGLSAIAAFTQEALAVNLEFLLLRIGLICVLVLVWVWLVYGELRIAERIYRPDQPDRLDADRL